MLLREVLDDIKEEAWQFFKGAIPNLLSKLEIGQGVKDLKACLDDLVDKNTSIDPVCKLFLNPASGRLFTK